MQEINERENLRDKKLIERKFRATEKSNKREIFNFYKTVVKKHIFRVDHRDNQEQSSFKLF
jgi:hypothetical protein